jgi:3-dehydroquinate dehydratase-2
VAEEPAQVRIAVIHGPNLNLLGSREPEVYGRLTLAALDAGLESLAAELGVELETHQANGEGALVDLIHDAAGRVDGFIVNAGAYTHTSIALLDALVGVNRPYVEVHISNLAGREPFRQHSRLSARALGVITGLGPQGYELALRGLVRVLRETGPSAIEASREERS